VRKIAEQSEGVHVLFAGRARNYSERATSCGHPICNNSTTFCWPERWPSLCARGRGNGCDSERQHGHLARSVMKPWLQYVIAFLVFCHGFVYVRIGSMLPTPVKGWTGHSQLLGDAISHVQLMKLIVSLHVIAGIAFLGCAIGIGVPYLLPGWWRPLALAGGLLGIVAFVVFWDGQTKLLFDEGGLGALISLMILVGAMAFPTAFE